MNILNYTSKNTVLWCEHLFREDENSKGYEYESRAVAEFILDAMKKQNKLCYIIYKKMSGEITIIDTLYEYEKGKDGIDCVRYNEKTKTLVVWDIDKGQYKSIKVPNIETVIVYG